jgi:hypothetical protein
MCQENRTKRGKHGRSDYISSIYFFAVAAMGGLPDVLRIPDEPEKLSLLPTNLPVSNLITFQLPP